MSGFDETASGLYIISVTPFAENGAVDLASTDRLMDFYLERGVSGVTILGILGEAPKLTQAEAIAFSRHVVRRIRGKVPVVVGVSGAGFAGMAETHPRGDGRRRIGRDGRAGLDGAQRRFGGDVLSERRRGDRPRCRSRCRTTR